MGIYCHFLVNYCPQKVKERPWIQCLYGRAALFSQAQFLFHDWLRGAEKLLSQSPTGMHDKGVVSIRARWGSEQLGRRQSSFLDYQRRQCDLLFITSKAHSVLSLRIWISIISTPTPFEYPVTIVRMYNKTIQTDVTLKRGQIRFTLSSVKSREIILGHS